MHLLAALIAIAGLLFLVQRLWLQNPERRGSIAATAIAAAFLLAILFLAATGRLHWLAAAFAALLPFLRRLLGLLRYLPYLSQVLGRRSGMGRGSHGGQRAGPRPRGALSPAEAREILGLTGSYTREDVIKAHRRLMQKVHPDRGGSNFFAQQLNAAKQVLLDELG
jgi:hypothetical protein